LEQISIEALREELGRWDRTKLENVTLSVAKAHAKLCKITLENPSMRQVDPSQAEKHCHVTEDEMKNRIRQQSNEDLISLLVDAAALNASVHSLLHQSDFESSAQHHPGVHHKHHAA
jgi:hypothetical protein